MLALILLWLVLLTQLISLNRGATGLPQLVRSEYLDDTDGRVKDDKDRAHRELRYIVKELSNALKQDTEGEATVGIDKKSQQVTHEAIDEQNSGNSAVHDRVGNLQRLNRKVLTKKLLKALRKERKRRREEKKLLQRSLILFQKPQTKATAAGFQDFVNYFKGVGQKIKNFFTRHPVTVTQDSGSEDSILSQDHIPMAEFEEESDQHAAQLQEIEEALGQELVVDVLKSAVKSGRVSKREVNDRDVLLHILNGLPFMWQSYKEVHHSKNSNDTASTSIAKDEEIALMATPDQRKSLPQPPTHDTALSIPYTASSEDMPTMIPTAIATTLNHHTQEQN